MSIYSDFAEAIVVACNTEGLDVDHATFMRFTATCRESERQRVELELPTWAQRRIAVTDPLRKEAA